MAIRSMPLNLGASNQPTIRSMPVASQEIEGQAQAQSQLQPLSIPRVNTFMDYIPWMNQQLPNAQSNNPLAKEAVQRLVGAPSGQDIQRAGAALLPGFVPEIGGLGGGMGEYLTNALARTGAGAAGDIGLNKDNINNMADLKRYALEGAKSSAYLEPTFGAMKLIKGGAEVYNPSYMTGQSHANEMANELSQARDWQKSAYAPVFEKHGNVDLTKNPDNFMQELGIKKEKLYPEAKKIYNDFMEEPNLNNLHAFQSQLFRDIASARSAEKPVSTQYFTQFRQSTRNAIRDYLSRDPQSLYNYDLGTNITKNYVEPYLATPKLEKLSEGVKEHVTPQEIAHEIRKGQENIIGKQGGEPITAIGGIHPLNTRLQAIENSLNRAQLMQDIIPDYSKGFVPKFANAIQNPYLLQKFQQAKPAYILGGKGFINQFNQ